MKAIYTKFSANQTPKITTPPIASKCPSWTEDQVNTSRIEIYRDVLIDAAHSTYLPKTPTNSEVTLIIY
jgi:hypothetical protein